MNRDNPIRRLVPNARQVYYGPNRGTPEWQAKGSHVWGCGNQRCVKDNVGGFCRSEQEAQGAAEQHASTHRGMVAVYHDG